MAYPPSFGRQVGHLARLWRTELDNRLRPLGLSQARWLLLVHLHEAPEDGMAQLDLAERAGVTGPTLVRQIDQLEKAGLVNRREDQQDRRVKWVRLTALGEAKFHVVDEIATSLRQEVLSDADAAELQAADALTRRLIARFETLAKAPAEEIA